MNFLLLLFLLIIYINKSLGVVLKELYDEIVFLNIYDKEQNIGDAIIIHSNDKYAMIDTGLAKEDENGGNVSFKGISDYINAQGITELEWVLLTHNHADHVGGMKDLLDIVKVKKVYTKSYNAYDEACHKESKEELLRDWNTLMDTIKAKIGEGNLHFIHEDNIDELTLGNYQFKLFNTEEAYTNYGEYCVNSCCNENVNSVVATVRNTVGDMYYYLGADIELYHLPEDPNNSFYPLFDDARRTFSLQGWIKKAKDYYENKGLVFDHFHVFKANHHGIVENEGGVNHNVHVFENAKPDICVVTSSSAREKLHTLIETADNGERFTIVLHAGDGTQVINNVGLSLGLDLIEYIFNK